MVVQIHILASSYHRCALHHHRGELPPHTLPQECAIEKMTTPAGRQQPAIPPLPISLQWHALEAATYPCLWRRTRSAAGQRMTTADKEISMFITVCNSGTRYTLEVFSDEGRDTFAVVRIEPFDHSPTLDELHSMIWRDVADVQQLARAELAKRREARHRELQEERAA